MKIKLSNVSLCKFFIQITKVNTYFYTWIHSIELFILVVRMKLTFVFSPAPGAKLSLFFAVTEYLFHTWRQVYSNRRNNNLPFIPQMHLTYQIKLITGFILTWAIRRVPYVKEQNLTLPEHLRSSLFLLMIYVMFFDRSCMPIVLETIINILVL